MSRTLVVVGVTLAAFSGGCLRLSRTRQQEAVDVSETRCNPQETVGHYALASTPGMREAALESLELRRGQCGFETRAEQEWALGHSEVIASFDRDGRIQRVWKRNTMPGIGPIERRTDLRVFRVRALANAGAVLRQRRPLADVENFLLRGRVPTALIAPGRLSLTVWLQRAHLAQGQKTRETVLDVRERIELIRDVTLMRLADDNVEGLGRVRVYTIFGREPFYANEQNIVVGDMMGMRAIASERANFRIMPQNQMNPGQVP